MMLKEPLQRVSTAYRTDALARVNQKTVDPRAESRILSAGRAI